MRRNKLMAVALAGSMAASRCIKRMHRFWKHHANHSG